MNIFVLECNEVKKKQVSDAPEINEKELCEILKGNIERLYFGDIVIMINEAGRLFNLPYTCSIILNNTQFPLMGPVIVADWEEPDRVCDISFSKAEDFIANKILK